MTTNTTRTALAIAATLALATPAAAERYHADGKLRSVVDSGRRSCGEEGAKQVADLIDLLTTVEAVDASLVVNNEYKYPIVAETADHVTFARVGFLSTVSDGDDGNYTFTALYLRHGAEAWAAMSRTVYVNHKPICGDLYMTTLAIDNKKAK